MNKYDIKKNFKRSFTNRFRKNLKFLKHMSHSLSEDDYVELRRLISRAKDVELDVLLDCVFLVLSGQVEVQPCHFDSLLRSGKLQKLQHKLDTLAKLNDMKAERHSKITFLTGLGKSLLIIVQSFFLNQPHNGGSK